MAEFDWNKYEKADETSKSDFNWDQYEKADTEPKFGAVDTAWNKFMQGASFGFGDELEGAERAIIQSLGETLGFRDDDKLSFSERYRAERDKRRRELEQAGKEHPVLSGLSEAAGGVTSSLALGRLPGVGQAARSLRGAATLSGGLGGLAGAGYSNAEDAEGLVEDILMGTGLGAGAGALGYGAGQLIQKGANAVSEKLSPTIAKMLPVGKKPNAPEIEAAAEAIGAKATPGMTSASETVQKLESSLHQAPTIGGWLTRRGTKPVAKAMQDTTKELIEDAATVSPFESGEAAKKILSDSVKKKFQPSKELFEDLAQYTKDVNVGERSAKSVARNIMNIPEVDVLELPLAKQVVKQLEKNPSVDQIKMLRTMVGKKAKSATDGAERSAYWQIYAKLGRLEENTLKRGILQSARTQGEGKRIAEGMLGQLRDAKKGYATQISDLQDFAQSARLGKVGSPDDFQEILDAVPSERLQEKLLPLGDVRQAKALEKQFPEAFRELRGARLRDLSKGVEVDREFIPGKLLQNTKGLSPEAREMLFRDKAPKLQNLRVVNEALPEKVGPSGTSQAFDVKEMLNPWTQARDLARFAAYKYASSDRLARLAELLKQQPRFANMAEKNPRAFQAMVHDLSKRLRSDAPLPRVASDNEEPDFATRVIEEEEARKRFLEGN